jgi:hypothetical protein
MKPVEATFNESTDGFTPVVEGTYPAHITTFDTKEFNESKVYNLSFTIADEVGKLDVPKLAKDSNGGYVQTYDKEGNPSTINAGYMAGNMYRVDKGVWLTPNPNEGEGWKNRRYKEFFESLGVEFPLDSEGSTKLAEVEKDDVIGFPCLIELRETSFTNSEGMERKAMKVINVFPWQEGQKLSVEELESDVPF